MQQDLIVRAQVIVSKESSELSLSLVMVQFFNHIVIRHWVVCEQNFVCLYHMIWLQLKVIYKLNIESVKHQWHFWVHVSASWPLFCMKKKNFSPSNESNARTHNVHIILVWHVRCLRFIFKKKSSSILISQH